MPSVVQAIGRKIVSVSRRSDILAFYSDWFLKILKSSIVVIENPFNHKKATLELKPENILGFVFWSRYPIGIKKVSQLIDDVFGQNHYINFTINDYPEEIEPRKPRLDKVFHYVDFLYDKYGENYIKWRFDPDNCFQFNTKRIYHKQILLSLQKIAR